MKIETIAILCLLAIILLYVLITTILEWKYASKTKITEIYTGETDREILALIKRDCKKKNLELVSITVLEKTDNYTKVIAILEER